MATATWMMASLLLVANADAIETHYINRHDFLIPVRSSDPNISEFRLYEVSPDGKTFTPHGSILPGSDGFKFHAEEDRNYYFKIAVVDKVTRKQVPEDITREGDVKCIIVDTAKPVFQVRSAERKGDEVVVHWDLIEKNPDYATFKLEYRDADAPGGQWFDAPVPAQAPPTGSATFHVSGPAVAVRLSMMDLAKNLSDACEAPVKNGTNNSALPPLTAAGDPAPGPTRTDGGWSPTGPGGPSGVNKSGIVATAGSDTTPVAGIPATRTTRGPLPPVQMVKKRQITIDYEVSKFGPSGIKSVDLYVTRDDGLHWQLGLTEDNIGAPLPPDGRPALPAVKRSLGFVLREDGLYGFYLIVKSGAGLGKPPPRDGIDVPQMRIEVDTTAPQARLLEPRPHPTRRDSLILSWWAIDNKLGARPITLQWAERPDGEWRSIGGGELPNTGEFVGQTPEVVTTGDYVWQVPANIPARVYLRLVVRDLAGNEAIGQTAEPILVDLSEPEVKPIQISVNPR